MLAWASCTLASAHTEVTVAVPEDATEGPAPARRALLSEEPHAFQWGLHIDGEGVSNLDGGLRRGTAYTTVLHGALALDTEPLGGWAGGRLAVSAVHIASDQPSLNYVGDVQGVSNLAAAPADRLYQLWYRQQFDWQGLRVRGGLLDMNQNFVATDAASTLLNASFGMIPTLTGNVPVSTYPKPGVGLEGHLELDPWHVKLGVFQADPEHRDTLFSNGHLVVVETGYRVALPHVGSRSYTLGVWQFHQSDRQLGDIPSSDWGAYGLFETHVPDSQTHVFLQLGAAPNAVNRVPYYLGAGFQIQGPLRRRAADMLTGGVAHAQLRGDALDAETACELSYIIAVHRFVSLQPDLQYIVHPGGRTDVNNALVASLRLHLEFY